MFYRPNDMFAFTNFTRPYSRYDKIGFTRSAYRWVPSPPHPFKPGSNTGTLSSRLGHLGDNDETNVTSEYHIPKYLAIIEKLKTRKTTLI